MTAQNPLRTRLGGELTMNDVDRAVVVAGWVSSRRDHGGVIFIDLRDRSGQVQVVANPGSASLFAIAEQTRNEFVLQVTGTVRRRPAGTVNADLPSGEIEVLAEQIELLNRAAPLPFQIDDDELSESVRLKYRFLDLRRPVMQAALRQRHQLLGVIRNFLDRQDFVEIETPLLTRSTPEGARDYLVPSRTQPGACFALPQSPQLFKQLLMVAGFERYYQIARCFRDEDLRADRQPEFTQLDVEMSFVDERQVMALMEQLLREIFQQVMQVALPDPIPRLCYAEAMSRYGSDRPDLRNPLQLSELTDVMKEVEFKVFAQPAQDPNGRVAALNVPGGAQLSRAQIDQYTDFVKQFGAKGLAYIKVAAADNGRHGLHSPILKFLSDDTLAQILARTGARAGDMIFFGADHAAIVNHALGALRVQVGEHLNLLAPGWQPLWVVDFPLLAWDHETRQWTPQHHPFTAPRPQHLQWLDSDPGRVLSCAYDMVLNGVEVGGGSIRIHRADLQLRVLKVLGIPKPQAEAEFGFLLEGLKYGAPPHGGIAFGLDRLAAMLSGVESIRDVIAFPKTQRAACLLTNAPNAVDHRQLRELGLQRRPTRAVADSGNADNA